MKIISILLIAFLVHVTVCGVLEVDTDAELVASEGVVDTEEEMVDTKEKLQMEPEEDEDDDFGDNGNGENGNGNIQNQDDDLDTSTEPTAQPTPQTPPNPIQPNPETRVYGAPGVAVPEQPQPEYSPYTPAPDRREPPQWCHGGQYQCQKTDPRAQTRCIPQEWRCNGLRDCEQNDDESGCTTDQLSRGRTQTKCTNEQYQCHGSGINSVPPHCIERRLVCDGTYQCSYGDDEANCADRTRPSTYPNRIPQQHNEQPVSRADPRDNRDMYRPQTTTSDRKTEEYVQKLEWRDRCFRSCLKH